MKRPVIGIMLLLGLVSTGGKAVAETRSATLSLKVVVAGPPCALTGATLDFGNYVSGQATSLFTSAAIEFTNCGPGTLTFALDGGGSGNPNARKLRSGSAVMNYNLYHDTGRTRIFGTGDAASSLSLATAGSGKVTIYGRIPALQRVAPGTYTDTVNVTLTF